MAALPGTAGSQGSPWIEIGRRERCDWIERESGLSEETMGCGLGPAARGFAMGSDMFRSIATPSRPTVQVAGFRNPLTPLVLRCNLPVRLPAASSLMHSLVLVGGWICESDLFETHAGPGVCKALARWNRNLTASQASLAASQASDIAQDRKY
jgi:hypothetical protein